ncbi:MAG: DUF58 domain-containing protein [Edaphocola sp.]
MQIPNQSAVENLDLLAKQVVEGFLIGLHKSPFHGFSVEFAEHRPYNQGDNLKYVDWKVYGRNDKMFVKKFEEETNLRACIAIDTSASMYYPENGGTKLQYSCVAAACLFYLLKKQLDAGSLGLFDTGVYKLTRAKTGTVHYRSLVNELQMVLQSPKGDTRTDAPKAIHQLAERLHHRSLVALFSDMPETEQEGEDLVAALQHLKYKKHEVIVFHVVDGKHELNFEFDNRPYEFVDMETGQTLKMNPADMKAAYIDRMNNYRNRLNGNCRQLGIDMITCDLNEPVEQVLYRYLLKRNKMM